jgi:hypothetical protein
MTQQDAISKKTRGLKVEESERDPDLLDGRLYASFSDRHNSLQHDLRSISAAT